jgi:hypothetical protein
MSKHTPPRIERHHLEDKAWFAAHPRRHYRLRPGWAIRNIRETFLATPLERDPPGQDTGELTAEQVWWDSAWRGISVSERREAAKRARPKPPKAQKPR